MNSIMNVYLIVLPLVFLAGFIDSIAGGGGLIALPAYLLAGIPVHIAMGTNKLSSSVGTFAASLTFFMHRQIWLKLALLASIFAWTGSYVGASLALLLSDTLLKTGMVVILPIMAFFILRYQPPVKLEQTERVPWLKLAFITFFVGLYDGLIGPGTGSMLIFAFVAFVNLSYTQASANAKVVNLASGLAALWAFAMSGQMDLHLGLWAALFSVLGNVSGSMMAIKLGKRIIQPLLIGVFALLMISLLWDVIRG
jgi:uncharacterized protein